MNITRYEQYQNPDKLPIASRKDFIIQKVLQNQVVIIHGETGSGKTTQIPQYLYELEPNSDKMIGITQPRRISAVNVSKWVARQMECGLGKEVGYEIRFENKSGPSTKIKFMTDGILLNQCVRDPDLSDYKTIIVDEAHERSLISDVLLGLLKMIMRRRDDLKIIITSATMDTRKLSKYFFNAPIVYIPGEIYNVEVIYEPDYNVDLVTHSATCVKNIHSGSESGDILVFLTGQEEIEKCVDLLEGIENLVVLPLFAAMEFEDQQKVFNKFEKSQRKVIVATNIAETGITLHGIRFIIDSGYVKQSNYKPNMGLEVLEDVRISKAQADQRKGRAGRTSNGWCYRLYSEDNYQKFSELEVPEIKRKILTEIYLKVLSFGLDPKTFSFLDSPDENSLITSELELKSLGFLDRYGNLTEEGKLMHDFPVEPSYGKVLLTSIKKKCVGDMVIILAMLTERNIFKKPRGLTKLSDKKKSQFHHVDGDPLTLLTVYKTWIHQNKCKKWCKENFIDFKVMEKVLLVKEQLMDILKRLGKYQEPSLIFDRNAIKECIISGYFRNICEKSKWNYYLKIDDEREKLYIHPSSSLFHTQPKRIIYMEIRKTTKPYMHGVMGIEDINI